jgi:3-phosphoshikimate 1-carboxyvinyltransferase
MKVTIHPGRLQGPVTVNISKSSMQRACAAALLAKGTSTILNPGSSNDDKAAIDVIQKLGAKVTELSANELIVNSNGVQPVSNEVNCGESGLGIRMFTPIVATSNQKITVTGSGSLVTRPMNFFDEIFPQLGIQIQSNNGKLPLQIQGPLQPNNIEVDGSLSSQFLTGLLMAYGSIDQESVIRVKELKSKPYIDLTLSVMKAFGVTVSHDQYEVFHIKPDGGFKPSVYTVEGDWSGAAFLLVAGAIHGDILVKGLQLESTQADKAIVEALVLAGARMRIDQDGIYLYGGALQAFTFDATECPDLFPPLVALAAFGNGKTVLKGALRLTHKESNRALTLQEEFGKMGVTIELNGDEMIVYGAISLKGAATHSHHDHRIAMACAVAATKAEGITTIEDAEAVNKSYPDFYQHIQQLGASVS